MDKDAWLNSVFKLKSNIPKLRKERFYKFFFNYIVFVPSKDLSRYYINFERLGLNTPHDYKLLIRDIKFKLNIDSECYIWNSDTKFEEVFDLFKKAKKAYRNFIYHKKAFPQLKSLYIKIRNALSHGNYYIKGQRIILWNQSIRTKNINALMILHLNDFYLLFDLLARHKQKKL